MCANAAHLRAKDASLSAKDATICAKAASICAEAVALCAKAASVVRLKFIYIKFQLYAINLYRISVVSKKFH